MPRIAKPPLPGLELIRKELVDYLNQNGSTPTAFARVNGLNQSTIQRFLAGTTKTITPKLKEALIYAKIDFNICIDSVNPVAIQHPKIRKALEKVWDGQEDTAEILAKLIEAMGPIISRSAQFRR